MGGRRPEQVRNALTITREGGSDCIRDLLQIPQLADRRYVRRVSLQIRVVRDDIDFAGQQRFVAQKSLDVAPDDLEIRTALLSVRRERVRSDVGFELAIEANC